MLIRLYDIYDGVREHLPERIPEWVMSIILINWGRLVLEAGDAMTNPAVWSIPLSWGARFNASDPELAIGTGCVIIGLIGIIALVVNGTFKGSIYSRYSPHVRTGAAMLRWGIWLMVYLSVSGVSKTGEGIYILPLILDGWCVFHASGESGRSGKVVRRDDTRLP